MDAVDPSIAARRLSLFAKDHSTVEMVSKRTGEPYYVARLAGYNALTFDLPRLKAMYGAAFFPFSYHVRDIFQRAMFYFDEHPELTKPVDLKLSTLCQYFGIESSGAHEALADVRMTIALYKRLARIEIDGRTDAGNAAGSLSRAASLLGPTVVLDSRSKEGRGIYADDASMRKVPRGNAAEKE